MKAFYINYYIDIRLRQEYLHQNEMTCLYQYNLTDIGYNQEYKDYQLSVSTCIIIKSRLNIFTNVFHLDQVYKAFECG